MFTIVIANPFEQLADQYCNIASQYCNTARKRTSDLALSTGLRLIPEYSNSERTNLYKYQ